VTLTDLPATSRRISAADPRYGEILDFLIDEAALLDDDRHEEWLQLMHPDVAYRMPIRKTLYRKDGAGFDDRGNHFDDNCLSLGLLVKYSVGIQSAFDRDPAPRIRRMVTNVVVHESATEGDYDVTSYVQLVRSRFDDAGCDMLTAKREDVLRRTPDGLRLASRRILVDQVAFAAGFFVVFM
jgi:3-phenylpropionate/cinnamic acid dioxygenase small subunit